jgi:acetylornithine deacetylase
MTEIKKGDAVGLTQALVRIDSRNPILCPGAPAEQQIAIELSRILRSWGFSVELQESGPGRPNVIARIGPPDTPAIIFAGHLDTVGTEGMSHDPFSGEIIDGRIYGRGSCDMKSGIAAMCAGALAAFDECQGSASRQVIIAVVTDEEYDSLGMRALIESGISAEYAIITEPTRLAICTAHRGFAWIEIEFTGRAAHGSRHDIGIDAIRHAGLVLTELDEVEATHLQTRRHSLLGRGSLHASTISGGIGLSTYPDKCVLTIERRTIPGETEDDALAEVNAAIERVRSRRPEISTAVRLIAAQLPSDVPRESPVVRVLERALAVEGLAAPIEGLSAWTDAALMNHAGITAVLFGPGDLGLAHAAEEFVPVNEIEMATAVLAHVAKEWMTEKT